VSQNGNTINIHSVDNNTVYTAGSGLSLSGTEFSVSGDLGTIDSATIGELNVDILDAEKILSRDLRVGPTGSTGGVENAAKIGTNGAGTVPNTTLTGAGAHLNKFGDFYLGNVSANKYIFWDQSAGTMTIRGSLDANDINGVKLDTGNNAQLSIGTTTAPGNHSVLIGIASGGTGLGNTSIGKFAGGGTTGNDNVAIGQDAGKSVTSGNENIMIGSHTGRAPGGTTANKTGSNNIGIGAVSNQNTANGTLSGLTSGSRNIAFGKGAGRSITTGSGNVIIGGYAGVAADQNTITLATGGGSRRLYFDTSGNATFTATVTGTRLFSTDGTNTISTFVSSSYNQISSLGSASGAARDLRFNFGIPGTVMTIKSTQVHMAKTVLLDGANTLSASSANIISATSNDGSNTTQYHAMFTRSNGTSALGRITTNNFACSFTSLSDYRLKENVQVIADATNKVLSLNPVNFQWKDSTVTQDGFLAHEVAVVVPEAVVGEKDGVEMQSLDQSKLVPLLVKTIQELEARIRALEE